MEPAEQSTAPSASSPLLLPNLTATLPKRQRNLGGELMLTQIILVDRFAFTPRRMIECQNGEENSQIVSSAPQTKTSAMSQSKEWSASKPQPSSCWPTQLEWGLWSEGTFPQQTSGLLDIIKWYWQKREWHWPRLSKDATVHSGMPLGVLCSAVQELCECSPP